MFGSRGRAAVVGAPAVRTVLRTELGRALAVGSEAHQVQAEASDRLLATVAERVRRASQHCTGTDVAGLAGTPVGVAGATLGLSGSR